MLWQREGEEGDLPVSQRVITQQTAATIKSLLDAVVELVTNSDDSYRRIEGNPSAQRGEIEIYVARQRGGRCTLLEAQDHAEGLSLDEILKVIEFGAETSGFSQGRSLRGLWGKGLKEAIFALGVGHIESSKDKAKSSVRLWYDSSTRRYKWRIDADSHETSEPNGTQVRIEVTNERIVAPTIGVLADQIRMHFALRAICGDPKRIVKLTLEDTRLKTTRPLAYAPPQAKLVLRSTVALPDLGSAEITVFESDRSLTFSNMDPCSEAGFLIQTEGIPLDNRLFGYENEEAAHYFYGWIECPGIAQLIRQGELGILDPARSGLDWRHRYAKTLRDEIAELLKPLIEKKRHELDTTRKTAVRQEYQKKLSDVCGLLNNLASEELEDLPGFGREPTEINTLVIRPDVGYGEPRQVRRFSVYLPQTVPLSANPTVTVELKDEIGDVRLSSSKVSLIEHPIYSHLLIGSFGIQGNNEGDSASIIASFEDLKDIAEFQAREPGHRRRPTKPRSGGLFRRIDLDDMTTNPIQRVSFGNGIITIFLNFPPISNYLRPGGDGMEAPQGSVVLAELVAEAFCREVARRRIDAGIVPVVPGGEIDAYNSEFNNLLRKYLAPVHSALVVV